MNCGASWLKAETSGSDDCKLILSGVLQVVPPSVDCVQYASYKTTPAPGGVPTGTSSSALQWSSTLPVGSTVTAWKISLRPGMSPATTGTPQPSPPSVDFTTIATV